MTPAARVQTAIEVLDEILSGTPAEKALTGWARRSRFAGSKDRAAVRDHVYDGLRRRNSASFLGGDLSGRGIMLGILRQDGADLDALFSGQGYGPAALSVAEQIVPSGDVPLDIPEWLVPRLRDSMGGDFETGIAAMSARAPVALRVNLQKTDRDSARRALLEDGIETYSPTQASTALIATTGARKVAQSKTYQTGLVELQDVSSQMAIEAIPLRSDMKVLDYCAGGGGKVLGMAGRATAQYFACDAIEARLRDLPNRAERAGADIQVITDPAQHAPYDLVFCDVPCSGSGTWRRTPDAKWRFTKADLDELTQVQAGILFDAAQLVAPGGVLVYATCSLLDDENILQIQKFMDVSSGVKLVSTEQIPLGQETDGFCFAVLEVA
ncbi:RsmB/NOP family class I SAM-dependent RNA methyltransferase [Shimia abyssi]|uniref:16S rRNA (Cytosine967-C5)-methyltransferase n=1 Tax=Shimia abyssi TaxID=1662395 RepID=A0A2P8FC68_9RHOB|nr:RsmB/NOP family class I SAM-dependent RNA methyltransferase [Shimia abyssi]PSL19294.1 16S rRNA (cytosine967-C5)-methyltransferase [Shimia abyssi]